MDKRKYNIYFHSHTISGIIIAALLYVIFFGGSFSFFRDDIGAWQRGKSVIADQPALDFNYLLDSLGRESNLKGRDFDFFLLRQNLGAYVYGSASKDTTLSRADTLAETKKISPKDRINFLYYFKDKQPTTYQQEYDMGEFLYRLHFLAQLNTVPVQLGYPFGYLLASAVAFIFLFALITGLLMHWNKIKSNFFVFRPWSRWKTVWTDMHTALGVIGFPFQFVFAVSGVALIGNAMLTIPYAKALYKGDVNQLNENLHYSHTLRTAYTYNPLEHTFDMNAEIAKWQKEWKHSRISRIYLSNFGDKSMQIGIEAKPLPKVAFSGSGFVKIAIDSGETLDLKSPIANSDYIDVVKALIYHLHFGDFGGRPLHIVFFILGAMGCLVIISGIMIWLTARDKQSVPPYKRKFNFWAANVFLSACLSMLPVTAFSLVIMKALPATNQAIVYNIFFYSWLALGAYLIARRNLSLIARQTLALSALLCLFVPVANGLRTGLWPWVSWQSGASDILMIDVLFTALAFVSSISWLKVKSGKSIQ